MVGLRDSEGGVAMGGSVTAGMVTVLREGRRAQVGWN